MTRSAVSIADILASEIGSVRYSIGDRFPAEQELQTRFEVGRHTIREALKELTRRGMIGRRPRSGTFVIAKESVVQHHGPIHNHLIGVDSSASTYFQISHLHWIEPGPLLLADYPDLTATRWLRIAGLRILRDDDRPLCWSEVFLPQDYAPPRQQIIEGGRPFFRMACEHSGVGLAGVDSGRGQDDTLSVFSMPPDDVCDGVFRDTEVTGDPSV